MILTHLRLKDFRSYGSLEIDFDGGLNLILGDNAAGKTNLAEAIHYISLARSWRSKDDGLLLKDGTPNAFIEADVKEGRLSRRIGIEIGRQSKKITLNGKPVRRLSELSRVTNVISFSPSDVPLFVGSPGERRTFLDVSLSKKSSDYFSLISRYNRLLKERNAALKAYSPDRNVIDALTSQMVATSEPLVRYRMMYVASLNSVLPDLLSKLRGEKTSCELIYRPFAKGDEEFKGRAEKAFLDALESDLYHKSTSVGPHREDFSLKMNGKDIATRGSQGENRMAVLALKLAPCLLVEEEDKMPICVLDDVTSELDPSRVESLIGLLRGLGQVFVTATKLEIEGASIIDVAENNAIRRK
ncbi:MAG: DNA replication/repair protein RecF [Bacilli bacterium]|nr:DNA replication/repair protein RecF [Bacilli bacterium]